MTVFWFETIYHGKTVSEMEGKPEDRSEKYK